MSVIVDYKNEPYIFVKGAS